MPPKRAPGRGLIVGAALFALIAAGFYLWSRRAPHAPAPRSHDAALVPDARVDAATVDATVIDAGGAPEMVAIAGGAFDTGFKDPAKFLAWCTTVEHDGAFCKELLKRAQPTQRRNDVASFTIDRTEVTRGQFAAWLSDEIEHGGASVNKDIVVDAHVQPLAFPGCDAVSGMNLVGSRIQVDGTPNAAAVCMTFAAAEAYCEAQHKRLPTLAEWQLAAGGLEHRVLPWGDAAPQCDTVIYGRDQGGPCAKSKEGPQSAEIAGHADVTPEGVVGMGGNVSEWVEDPSTPPTAPQHIAAGGSWTGGVADMTPAKILIFGTADMSFPGQATIGFRCARSSN